MVQISIASAAASFLQEFSQSVACNLSETFQPTVTHLVVFRLSEVRGEGAGSWFSCQLSSVPMKTSDSTVTTSMKAQHAGPFPEEMGPGETHINIFLQGGILETVTAPSDHKTWKV